MIASRPPMRGLAGVGCALTRRAPKAAQGCLCPRASAAIHSDSASAPQPLPVESLSGGFKASAAGPAPARPVGRAFRRPGRGLAGDAAPPAAPIPAASLPLVCARNGSRRAAGLHGPLPRTRWCRERAEALPKQPRPAPRSRGSASFPPSAPPPSLPEGEIPSRDHSRDPPGVSRGRTYLSLLRLTAAYCGVTRRALRAELLAVCCGLLRLIAAYCYVLWCDPPGASCGMTRGGAQ